MVFNDSSQIQQEDSLYAQSSTSYVTAVKPSPLLSAVVSLRNHCDRLDQTPHHARILSPSSSSRHHWCLGHQWLFVHRFLSSVCGCIEHTSSEDLNMAGQLLARPETTSTFSSSCSHKITLSKCSCANKNRKNMTILESLACS